MKTNRATVQKWLGLSEGGYSNHPDDPGGPTDRGITQKTYDAWNARKGRDKRSVRGISKAEAEAIIATQYMDPVRFDDLPSGLDYAVADYAVNSGPAQAVTSWQRIVGAGADGVMGEMTLAAIGQRDPESLIVALCEARLKYMRGLKNWRSFKRGWTARVMGNHDGVQPDDIGVIDRAVRMARGAVDIPAPPKGDTAKASPEVPGLGAVLKDPVALGPLAGVALPALVGGNGPVQWAVAAAVLIGVLFVIWRAVRRANA